MDKQTTCQLIQKISKLGGSSESVQILLVECLWSSLQDLPKNSLVPTRCPLLQWDCLPHPDEKEQLPRKPSKNIKHSHQRHRLHRLFSSPLADARLKHPPICVGRAVRRRPGTGLKSCHHYAPGKNSGITLRQRFTNGTYNFWNDCFSATGDRFFLHSHMKQKKMKDTLR